MRRIRGETMRVALPERRVPPPWRGLHRLEEGAVVGKVPAAEERITRC